MKIKSYIFILLITVIIFSLIAFSTNAAPNVKEDKDIYIIFSEYSLVAPFHIAAAYGFAIQLERMGIRSAVMDAGSVMQRQLEMIDDAITRGASAIVIFPMDSDALSVAVKKCNEANIPVISIDRSINGGIVTTTLQSDNVEAGRKVAREFVVQFKKKGLKEFNLIQLRGQLGSSPSQDRDKGFWEIMNLNPDIKVNLIAKAACEWDPAKAMEATLANLTAHPEINAIYYEADTMAPGIFAAIDQLGLLVPQSDPKHIINGGVDGDKHGLESIRSGLMDVDISQMPHSQGMIAAYLAYHAVKYGSEGLPSQLFFDTQTLTPENISSFGSSLWGDLPIGGAKIPDELKKLLLK